MEPVWDRGLVWCCCHLQTSHFLFSALIWVWKDAAEKWVRWHTACPAHSCSPGALTSRDLPVGFINLLLEYSRKVFMYAWELPSWSSFPSLRAHQQGLSCALCNLIVWDFGGTLCLQLLGLQSTVQTNTAGITKREPGGNICADKSTSAWDAESDFVCFYHSQFSLNFWGLQLLLWQHCTKILEIFFFLVG